MNKNLSIEHKQQSLEVFVAEECSEAKESKINED